MNRDENSTNVQFSRGELQAHTIAVTGATGLIGRKVTAMLQQSGYSLRLLTRKTAPAEQPGITWVNGDLLSLESLHELVRGADAVIHLAGLAHTPLDSAADCDRAFTINVGGTQRLVQACAGAGVPRFVFMSSAHVYTGHRGMDLDENSPTAGDSPYSGMKLKAETEVMAMADGNCRVTVLRPCLVYGPGAKFNLQTLQNAMRRGLYVHPGKIKVVRSMASVDTVAAAVLHVLKEPSCEGIYNVADRDPVQMRLWVNHLAEMMRVRKPRTAPLILLRMAALAGSIVKSIGLNTLLTLENLSKLTESFSLNVHKLAATGFVWPETNDAVLQQMIDTAPSKGQHE